MKKQIQDTYPIQPNSPGIHSLRTQVRWILISPYLVRPIKHTQLNLLDNFSSYTLLILKIWIICDLQRIRGLIWWMKYSLTKSDVWIQITIRQCNFSLPYSLPIDRPDLIPLLLTLCFILGIIISIASI